MPGDAWEEKARIPSPSGFNPRPARVPGDAISLPRRITRDNRFNPRPARVPGDAKRTGDYIAFLDVSIRARHVCRAMRRNPAR